ncbi:hypothetical protein [Niabella beijingensis]|uniref:hypothetical protein n=1 Tax=Niabella beijingensis TaxID=2872700 RepID=UPI001CBE8EAE|nr:hypothetical protein [Niabella beijingensis]MBZ4192570.1 hypothetical protein [Niabella beijingensis]
MIPHTYHAWRHCLEQDCGIRLTEAFAQKRLRIYRDATHPETKRFADRYGAGHLRQVIRWFETFLNQQP